MFENKLHAVWKFETLVRRGIEYQLIRYYKYFTFVRREKNMRGIILWSLIIIIYLKICERMVSSEADKRFRMGAKPSNNRGFGVWNKPLKGRAPAMRKASTANNKKLNLESVSTKKCHDALPNCQQLRQKQGCRKIHSKCEKVKFLSVSSAWLHHDPVMVYFQSCGLCPGMTPHPSLKSPKGSQNKSLKRGTNPHPSLKATNKKLVRGNPCNDVASNCKELRPKHGCRKIAEKCKKVSLFRCEASLLVSFVCLPVKVTETLIIF